MKVDHRIALLFILLLSSCSSFKGAKHAVVAGHDMTAIQKGEAKEVKEGEEIIVEKDPVFLHAKGKKSAIVFPASSNTAKFNVNLPDVNEETIGHFADRKVNKQLNKLVEEISKVQILLSKKQFKQALESIKLIKKDYPRLSYLHFLEASCYLMLGQRGVAKDLLRQGLEDFPENEDAKKLYLSLLTDKERQDFRKGR